MLRVDLRTTEAWGDFDRTALVICVSLASFLFVMWLLNMGPLSTSRCCQPEAAPLAADVSADQLQSDMAVLESLPLLPFFFSLQHQGEQLFMSGKVASEAERQQLLAAVKSHFGEIPVATSLVVEEGVVPINIALLDNLLEETASVHNLLLTYSPEQWLVDGDVAVGSQLRRLSDLMAGLAEDGQLRLINNLQVVKTSEAEGTKDGSRENCDATLASAKIEFAVGSYELTSAGKSAIHNMLYCLSAGSYQIVGHRDTQSSSNTSRTLSQARAQAVQNYLVHLGVDPTRLSVVEDEAGAEAAGKQTSNVPAFASNAQAGRSQSRRIEFKRTQ